jgi:hypothetical protein
MSNPRPNVGNNIPGKKYALKNIPGKKYPGVLEKISLLTMWEKYPRKI